MIKLSHTMVRTIAMGLVWIMLSCALGLAIPHGIIAVGRTTPEIVDNEIARFIVRVLWPTSIMIPPLFDSVDPRLTYRLVDRAIALNCIPYAFVATLLYAMNERVRSKCQRSFSGEC
jgi:hypothetical protein